MILVDLNVLIYAIDEDSPWHETARRWFEDEMSGDRRIGFAWSVLLGFVRIVTRPGLLVHSLSPATALEYVDEWLTTAGTPVVVPTERHWPILRALLENAGTAANLTSDAHLAALALEHGASIASFDRDFRRFSGVRLVVPGER